MVNCRGTVQILEIPTWGHPSVSFAYPQENLRDTRRNENGVSCIHQDSVNARSRAPQGEPPLPLSRGIFRQDLSMIILLFVMGNFTNIAARAGLNIAYHDRKAMPRRIAENDTRIKSYNSLSLFRDSRCRFCRIHRDTTSRVALNADFFFFFSNLSLRPCFVSNEVTDTRYSSTRFRSTRTHIRTHACTRPRATIAPIIGVRPDGQLQLGREGERGGVEEGSSRLIYKQRELFRPRPTHPRPPPSLSLVAN